MMPRDNNAKLEACVVLLRKALQLPQPSSTALSTLSHDNAHINLSYKTLGAGPRGSAR